MAKDQGSCCISTGIHNYTADNGELPPPQRSVLTSETVASHLSIPGRTTEGLAFAFLRLDLNACNLTDISLIASFTHLRFVDISSNFLDSLTPLEALPHLLWLRAESCGLRSVILQSLGPYLQWLSLAHNEISAINGLSHPHLKTLLLNGSGTSGGPQASNKTVLLEGLNDLKNLSHLHLRDNRVSNLDGFVQENPEDEILPSLHYLNLRGNSICDMSEILKLKELKSLRVLILLDCPLAGESNYSEFVISCLHLQRLDKETV
uniref:leucine-rich repeat-containing protein 23 n=1 Tax=Myxine glutinosa TaxID=7769 RepID=UPI00358F1C23